MNSLEIDLKKKNFSKEIEDIKENQVEIIKLKNAITKIKNSLRGSIIVWR